MNKWLSLVAATFAAASVYGQNNVLAQLGARGTTVNAGTSAYRDYIVRLGADGRFSMTTMPQALVPSPFTQLVYIDPGTGADNAGATGSVTQPYKTLGYAAAAFAGRAAHPVVYLLQPGTYGTVTLDALALPGLTDFAVCGYGQDSTYIPEIEFESAGAGADVTVTVSGVRVGRLAQRNSKAMTVRLRDGARVDVLDMDYPTTCAVTREANSVIGVFEGATPYSETLVATAASISFYFNGTLYTNVNNALNYLLAKDRSAVWVSPSDTNGWSYSARTWTNSPAFGITAADTNKWNVLAIGGTNNYMWTVTALEWSNSVAKAITSVDTQHWNAAYHMTVTSNVNARLRLLEGRSNIWNSAATTINSHVGNSTIHVTSLDKSNWNTAKSEWDSSAAKRITPAMTNAWTKPTLLWSTNTTEDTVRWLELDVTSGHEELVLYEARRTYVAGGWVWYVTGDATVSWYSEELQQYEYETVWTRGTPYAILSWPRYLRLGNLADVPSDVEGYGSITVGAGTFGGCAGVGMGDSSGIVINYGGQPPDTSVFDVYPGPGTYTYGDFYWGVLSIYRVDDPPVPVVTTNELNRFTGTDALTRALYARDNYHVYAEITNGQFRIVQQFPYAVTNTEYMTLTFVEATEGASALPFSMATTAPLDAGYAYDVFGDTIWFYDYTESDDHTLCYPQVRYWDYPTWQPQPDVAVGTPLWQQLPLTLSSTWPGGSGTVILSNIITTAYSNLVLFALDAAPPPGVRLGTDANIWVEFDNTNLLLMTVERHVTAPVTNITFSADFYTRFDDVPNPGVPMTVPWPWTQASEYGTWSTDYDGVYYAVVTFFNTSEQAMCIWQGDSPGGLVDGTVLYPITEDSGTATITIVAGTDIMVTNATPFIASTVDVDSHVTNDQAHVTAQDRAAWNAKVSPTNGAVNNLAVTGTLTLNGSEITNWPAGNGTAAPAYVGTATAMVFSVVSAGSYHVDLTDWAATGTTFNSTIEWDYVPELTVTGRYEFAFSQVGAGWRGTVTWPRPEAWHALETTAPANATEMRYTGANTQIRPRFLASGSVSNTFIIANRTYSEPSLYRVPLNIGAFADGTVLLAYSSGYYSLGTLLSSNTVYSAGPSCATVAVVTTPVPADGTDCIMTFAWKAVPLANRLSCVQVRRMSALEVKAYEAGWRP